MDYTTATADKRPEHRFPGSAPTAATVFVRFQQDLKLFAGRKWRFNVDLELTLAGTREVKVSLDVTHVQ